MIADSHAIKEKVKRPVSVIPDKIVACDRPNFCPRCKSRDIHKHTKQSKTVHDLKFMRHGIKRWITRYDFHNYQCQNCRSVFRSEEESWSRSKYGANLIAYAIYLNIELRLPQIQVDRSLNRLFGLGLPDTSGTHSLKKQAAEAYRVSTVVLLKRLCNGRLLHADETKISIRGRDGFVWVFANMEEVVYIYNDTRDGKMLHTILKDFRGVLVSDFYAAYDGIPCPQQKCLIHLIRDLNDDVLKHPYDDDLKRVVSNFSALLKPIMETIDRYGLKSHFLKKHQADVDRFYRQIRETTPKSEIAVKLQERFEKNRDKLFTFLRFDGVPWNNNNAEHAVKPFAAARHIIGGLTTEKGISDYLVLLSLCQTCKYRGVDFLDFLRSGDTDVQAFAETRHSCRRKPQ